ncbi:MAG: glycosyltransferase [Chloroflexi bacterium]|nr:MAG: glycosyltransferase [Chloroflexota bacterium]
MHIVLLHFYSKTPTPEYQKLSVRFRKHGHKVWIGLPDDNDDVQWLNDQQVVATLPGPEHSFQRLAKLAPFRKLAYRLQYLAMMWRVRSFLQEHKPDVVQINMDIAAWVLPLFGPKKTRYVLDIRQINEHVSERPTARLKEKLLIFTLQMWARFFFDRACFLHEGGAIRILGKNWKKKGSVVPLGVDNQFLQFDVNKLSQSSTNEPVRFIYLGIISPLRTLERLLYAAKKVSSEAPNFCLDFVGPDAANGHYQQLAKELELDNVVNFLPPVHYEAVPDLLAKYDVGLAYIPDRPTWHYHPTIKVLEYRALGLPIISTDVASHREVVQEGVNGLLVKDDANSIAKSLHRFVDDRGFLQQCKENAVQMRGGVTWAEVAEMYENEVY